MKKKSANKNKNVKLYVKILFYFTFRINGLLFSF